MCTKTTKHYLKQRYIAVQFKPYRQNEVCYRIQNVPRQPKVKQKTVIHTTKNGYHLNVYSLSFFC